MLVSNIDMFTGVVNKLNSTDAPIVVDYEADGKDWRLNSIVGIALYCSEVDVLCYIPIRHLTGTNLSPHRVLSTLFTEVIHPKRAQIYFHGSFDMKIARKDGYRLPERGFYFDPILGFLCLNENEGSFKLETLATRYVNKNAGSQEDKLIDYLIDRYGGAKSNAKGHLWKADPAIVGPYAEQDCLSTGQLAKFCQPHLKTWSLLDVYREICDFQILVAKIELRGIMLNQPILGPLRAGSNRKAAELLGKIRKDAGYDLNPNSVPQVRNWLNVASTAAAHLARLDDPRAADIIDYRKYVKAESTFYKPYLKFMDKDGILRCNLHLTTPGTNTKGKRDSRNGTISGRLSSSKPNLQQIPRESDKYKVKHVFRARPGYYFIELDYSQAELRIAAHYSRDQRLTEILLSGGDLHAIVAEELNVPRQIAKPMNFAAWYGIGWRKFAEMYFIPPEQARSYLKNYHRMFPGIRRLAKALEARALKDGYIRLYTGRMRRYNIPKAKPRTASNNLIQGTVAQMLQLAMLECDKKVPWARQILTVHDSVWFEVPDEESHIYQELGITAEEGPLYTVGLLTGTMQQQPHFSLPMVVDRKMGKVGFADAVVLPRDPVSIPPEVLARCTDPVLVQAA